MAPTVLGSGNNELYAQQPRGNFLITLTTPYVPILLIYYTSELQQVFPKFKRLLDYIKYLR